MPNLAGDNARANFIFSNVSKPSMNNSELGSYLNRNASKM